MLVQVSSLFGLIVVHARKVQHNDEVLMFLILLLLFLY